MTLTLLKTLRRELGYTQQDFAVHAGLRITTFQNAERGKNTSYKTASTILITLNELRAFKSLEPVKLEDLGLQIV